MRLRNIPQARERIEESEYVVKEPERFRGQWRQQFPTPGELHVEVGMGKGRFLHEMARLHPECNFVGIEMYSSVLLRGLQKMEADPLPNIRLICMDAREIETVFAPGEVDRIYLNFSDPWPKDRHAKRRLCSRQFLERFGQILKADGRLEFKTDNRALFDFGLEELGPAGWQAKSVTFDLHRDSVLSRGNVMTEYEEKFSGQGNPICKYVICQTPGVP